MKTNKKLLTSLISISMCSMLIPMNGIQNIYATEGGVTLANNGNISKDEIINALIPDSQLEHKVDDNEKVEVPDYNLRRGICELMNYKDVDNAVITKRDMRRIRYLSPEVCQAHDNSEHGVRVKDLEGLQYAENLEKLSMVNQAFGDISPLSNLTKLKYLDLRNVAKDKHGIKDVSPLKRLVNLEYLNLFKAEPTNVNELENLVKLKSLNLGATKINSVDFVKNMTNLEYLNLEHNEFTDISALENLVNLKTLLLDSTVKSWITDTSKSRIKDISKLNKLTKLEELGVSNNNIEEIDVVKNFKKLTKFHATNNNITNFESLLSLRGLQEVWIQENKNSIVKSAENYLKAKELFSKLNKDDYVKEDAAIIESLLNADNNIKKFFGDETLKALEKYKEELQTKDKIKNTLFEDIRLNQINGSIEKIAKVKDVKIKVGENLLDKLPKTVKVRVKLDKKEPKGEIEKNSSSDVLKIAVVSAEGNFVADGIELVSNTGKKYTVTNGIVEVKASDAVVPYTPYSLSYNGKKVFEFYNTGYNRVGNIKGSNGVIDVAKADDISKYLVSNIDKGLAENNNSATEKPGTAPKPAPGTEEGTVPKPAPGTEEGTTPKPAPGTEEGTTPKPVPGTEDKENKPIDTTGLGIVGSQIIYKVVDENGKAVELDAPLVAAGEYDSKQSTFENGLYKFKSAGEDSEFRISINSSKYQLVGTYSFATVYNNKLPNANSFSYIVKNNIKENFSKEGKITNKDVFVIQVKTLKDNTVTPPAVGFPSAGKPTDETRPVKPEVHKDSRIGVKKDARNNVSLNYKVVDQSGKEINEMLGISAFSPNNQDINLKYNNGIYTYTAQGIDDTFTIKLKSDKYELANSYTFRDKYNVKTFKGEISSVKLNSEDTSKVEEADDKFFTLVVTEKKVLATSNNTGFRAVGNSGSTDTVDVTLPVEYDLTNVDVNTPGEYEVIGKVVHGENIRNDKDLKVNVKVIVTAKDSESPTENTEGNKPDAGTGNTEGNKPDAGTGNTEGNKPDAGTGNTEGNKPDVGTGNTEGNKPDAGIGNTEGNKPDAGTGNTEGNKPDTGTGNTEGNKPDVGTGNTEGSKPDTGAGNTEGSKPDAGTGNTEGNKPDTGTALPEKLGVLSAKLSDGIKVEVRYDVSKVDVDKFVAQEITGTEADKVKELVKDLNPKLEVLKTLELHFEKDGKEVKAIGEIRTVTLAVTVDEGKTLKVYHVNGDKLEEVPSSYVNGKLTFYTKHFSKFIITAVPTAGTSDISGDVGATKERNGSEEKIVEKEAKEGSLPNTGMNSANAMALGLSLITLLGLVVRRKLSK